MGGVDRPVVRRPSTWSIGREFDNATARRARNVVFSLEAGVR